MDWSGGEARLVVRAPEHVLSAPAAPCEPAAPELVALARDLVATMRGSPGCVGLAAPQVGVGVRVFCADVTAHRKARSRAGLIVLANPRLLAAEAPVVAREGCLSVPDLTGDVPRASRVIVAGVVPGSGEDVVVEADAFEARALQHEIDHLDGRLFLDRP